MFSSSESQMRSGAQMDCSLPKPAVLSTSRPLSPSLSTIHPHHNVYSPFIYSRPFLCHFPFMCVCVCPLMLADSECDCIVNMCSIWFLHDCRMAKKMAKNAIKSHFRFWLREKIDQIVEQKALLYSITGSFKALKTQYFSNFPHFVISYSKKQ